MWTMHDWLGFREGLGMFVSGNHACPLYGLVLGWWRSNHLDKIVYKEHGHFLPEAHKMRGSSICKLDMQPLKASNCKSKWDETKPYVSIGMERLSIFHELPYWSDLFIIPLLLHPMNIFKNVGDIIWKTITIKMESNLREMIQRPQDGCQSCGCVWIVMEIFAFCKLLGD